MTRFKFRLPCAGVLWLLSGLAAAQGVLSENFDSNYSGGAIGSNAPSGWSVATFNAATGGTISAPGTVASNWLGWKFVGASEWATLRGSDSSRGAFTLASNGIAVAESDGITPSNSARFTTALSSPALSLKAGKTYELEFASHYKQGGNYGESVEVEVKFDSGTSQTLLKRSFADMSSGALASKKEVVSFPMPAGATAATLVFSHKNTSNNWYWAIDNVKVSEVVPPPPFDPSALPESNTAPALTVGPTLQNPGTSHMAVMLDTSESSPTVWVRKKGSASAFTIVEAKRATDAFADNTIAFAELTSLESNTLYEYAVVTGDSRAPKVAGPYQFKTWPAALDGVSQGQFVAISDTQNGLSNRLRNIVSNGMIANHCEGVAANCADRVAGILVSGDLVGSGGTRSQWSNELFGPLSTIAPYVPLIPVPGNHEYTGSPAIGAQTNWATNYRRYFNKLPGSGSAAYPLHWYHLDYLGLRIVGSDFTPASAMHNTGNWGSATYDYGRALFHEDYMAEQLSWFTKLMSQTRADQKSQVLLLNHHPCLSEKWRQGEVMATCDFISQMESYGKDTGAITASLYGHVHFYERGNSMDSRHLWLNVATASGSLEGAKQADDSDLDVFAFTKLSYGYGALTVGFGDVPSMQWRRYDLNSDGTVSAEPVDQITVNTSTFDMNPQLSIRDLGAVDPSSVTLGYGVEDISKVYESQWQLSKNPSFDTSAPIYDVWGNATRRENWSYINGVRTNTRANADMSQLALGQLVANPARVYPNASSTSTASSVYHSIVAGGNALLDRWRCEYKYDAYGDTGDVRQGGRQCYARLTQETDEKGSAFDPFATTEPQLLAFAHNEKWYWRVRVRDEHLNWSGWSQVGSFQFGEVPTPETNNLIDEALPASSTAVSNVHLNVSATARCSSVQRSTAALPASAVPEGWTPLTDVLSFTLGGCDELGFTANIALSALDKLPSKARLMKVREQDGGGYLLEPLEGAVFDTTGKTVSYQVVDGGYLDEDGARDAAIKDPVVVLVPTAADPDPGTSVIAPVPVNHPMALALLSMLVASFAGWLAGRRKH